MRLAAALLVLLLATPGMGPAHAQATGPAPAPAGTPALPQAALAGAGRLTVWGFAVYDARLWVAPGFRRGEFAAHLFALELAYLRAFSAEDIARRSLEEMARSGPIDADLARRWQDALVRLLPDVQAGDRITGVHRPGRGAEFFHNGRRLGEVADPGFSPRFFAIWLGPATSEPRLRDVLLAGTPP
jgi:hypothetical protein